MAEQKLRLNPILKVLLEGVFDENSELSNLNGMLHILQKIWRYVTDFWKSNIKIYETFDPKEKRFQKERAYLNLNIESYEAYDRKSVVYCRDVPYTFDVEFPKPTGIQINMMPFVMDLEDFSKCRLPDYLRPYWENIAVRCNLEDEQIGKIGYLTIQESSVEKGTSQRRPGLHTERPGLVRLHAGKETCDGGTDEKEGLNIGSGYSLVRRYSVDWGNGWLRPIFEKPTIKGGIYMASNVSNSCMIYNCEVIDDELIGELGDVEHLRAYLPEGELLEKNCIYWFTDRTPHESLPLNESTDRQFFRLVTSEVSLWYEEHSTKNPLGVVPDPKITKIVRGSKFGKNGVVISDI